MNNVNAVITGVGGYVPDYILDNEEMSTIVETSDEWIMERIGVKTRHILKPEQGTGTSYMMIRAVKQVCGYGTLRYHHSRLPFPFNSINYHWGVWIEKRIRF